LECFEWWDGRGPRHLAKAAERAADPCAVVHRQDIPDTLPATIRTRIRRYHKWLLVNRDAVLAKGLVPSNFPECESACRFGGVTCPFRRLCTAPYPEWKDLVAVHYTQDPDPLDSDPTRRTK
jgi:hypothetical protein